MKKYFAAAALIMAAAAMTSCSAKKELSETKISENRKSIVTVMFAQYEFARNVAGNKADVMMLLKPGAESHSYEPTPEDIRNIQKADLFIYTGADNDAWVDRILDSMGDKAPRTLKILNCVDVKEEILKEGMQDEEEEEESGEIEIDEHVWTTPSNAIKICEDICSAMEGLDGANADIYKENTASYINELKELDEDFSRVRNSAKLDTFVFGDRFPLRYFADEYDLDYYAAFPGCATDVEVNAQTIKFLIDKVKELHIPVIFTIELSNQKIAKTIAESTGAKIETFYTCHNVSADDMKSGATYISMMKHNVEVLKEALKAE